VRNTYYTHKHHRDFKRRVAELINHTGQPTDLLLVLYVFSGEEHQINVQPYGKSGKTSAHRRTRASTLESMREKGSAGQQGRKLLEEMYDEAGGIVSLQRCSLVPRNESRVYIMKHRKTMGGSGSEKDELFHLIEKTEHYNAGGMHVNLMKVFWS